MRQDFSIGENFLRTAPFGDEKLSLLTKLLAIESVTAKIQEVNRAQQILGVHLSGLGFKNRFVQNPKYQSADLLISEKLGKSKKVITLVGHADMVSLGAHPIEMSWSHEKVVAPGIIDNKGGLVIGISALKQFLSQRSTHEFTLRFISSPNEEAGSIGFHDFYKSLRKNSMAVLGLEPALTDGSIISSRRGNRWYDLKIFGKGGHSGRIAKNQINAAHELAHKCVHLMELSQPKKGISVHVNHVVGGRGDYNVICDEAIMKVDARFKTSKQAEELDMKIRRIAKKAYITARDGVTKPYSTLTEADNCPPFSKNKRSKSFLDFHVGTLKKIENKNIAAQESGGASDVNHLQTEDSIVIDGLGPVGGNMHLPTEWIYLPSLRTRTEALYQLLNKLMEAQYDC